MNVRAKRFQAIKDVITEDHVRFVMTLDYRNKLPEAFRDCISQVKVTRDTLEAVESKWEALSALCMMAGLTKVTRQGDTGKSGMFYYVTPKYGQFVADLKEVDPALLFEYLRNE